MLNLSIDITEVLNILVMETNFEMMEFTNEEGNQSRLVHGECPVGGDRVHEALMVYPYILEAKRPRSLGNLSYGGKTEWVIIRAMSCEDQKFNLMPAVDETIRSQHTV